MATAPARVFRINPERKHSFELLLLFLGLAPTVAIAIFAYRYEVLWKFLADRSYLALVFVMPFLGLGMVWINSRILAGARLTLDGQGLALTYREKPFFGLAPAPADHGPADGFEDHRLGGRSTGGCGLFRAIIRADA